MASVRPSVPTFQNLAKQNKARTMFATGETVGLAEWIIDDTCLVYSIFNRITPAWLGIINVFFGKCIIYRGNMNTSQPLAWKGAVQNDKCGYLKFLVALKFLLDMCVLYFFAIQVCKNFFDMGSQNFLWKVTIWGQESWIFAEVGYNKC